MRLTGKLLGYGIIAAVSLARLGLKFVPDSVKQRVRLKAVSLYLKMQGVQ